MTDKKIKTQKEIVAIVKNLKKQGRKIVTYNGSFDIIHAGHVQVIRESKSQGDVLIILLNSDASVRMYKGPNRPINQQNSRARMLAALADVDYLVLFDQINPKEILDLIKPDIHCNGDDWGKNCVERNIIEKNGGKIHILKWQDGFSTSNIIEKILNTYSLPEVKAVFLDRDGTINIARNGYVREVGHFRFTPGAMSALKKLSKSEYKIIVITNQSGIARKFFKESELRKIHHHMMAEIKKAGARIDAIYYCPHYPDGLCSCRKPKIGMLLQAAKDFSINLSKSWFVGDDQRDVVAGRDANIKTIKIGDKMPKALKLESHYYSKNLLQAASIILKNSR